MAVNSVLGTGYSVPRTSPVRAFAALVWFSVRRQGNASFVRPLAAHRSQIYSEMTLDDFVKNLNVFQEENLR